MESRLPHDKILKCIDKIKFARTQKSLTLTQLQSVLGLLTFACNVVLPSRVFLRRLIDLTIGVSKPFFKISMTKEVKIFVRYYFVALNTCLFHCMIRKVNGN